VNYEAWHNLFTNGFQIQQLEKLSRTQGAYGMTIFTLMGV